MFVRDYKEVKMQEDTVVTIGNFDGVHLGHRTLISRIREICHDTRLIPVVLTFSPHPMEFFCDAGFFSITTDAEKTQIFNKLDVDNQVFLEFNTGLANLTPEEFVINIVVRTLKCRHLVVGENFRFGKGRAGSAETLEKLCYKNGVTLELIKTVQIDGSRVSSDRIRQLLLEGNVSGAHKLLVEPFYVFGEIIRGKCLGKTLSFPTINQKTSSTKLLPKDGVYFTETGIGGKTYGGITNVGVRPTVGGKGRTVETFLLGFDGEVYGETASVRFLERRRDEIMFENTQQLKEAVRLDSAAAEAYFAGKHGSGRIE